MRVELMQGGIFRPMATEDIPEIAEMEKICFRSPWTERMLREELRNRVAHYHVIEGEQGLIAYAGMWVLYEEAHITNVAVLPAYRRHGYGEAIMLLSMEAAIMLQASEMTLEVRESNAAAQALYEKLGFETTGKRKRYYSDTGEDALILWNRDMRQTVKRLRT